jgi:antitoxin PrlF
VEVRRTAVYKAKVTSKGQITIPAEVREAMGLKPGEKVVFLPGPGGAFTVRRIGSIMELEGCLAGLGLDLPKSDEELNEIIRRRALELDEATKSGARRGSESEAA